ncbi:SUMO1 sentrin specific peptidase 8 [Homalodisca vitripennis]|nr:SUMO1 sentrin specific peptidase 8 [Homalodisca vitripennis]
MLVSKKHRTLVKLLLSYFKNSSAKEALDLLVSSGLMRWVELQLTRPQELLPSLILVSTGLLLGTDVFKPVLRPVFSDNFTGIWTGLRHTRLFEGTLSTDGAVTKSGHKMDLINSTKKSECRDANYWLWTCAFGVHTKVISTSLRYTSDQAASEATAHASSRSSVRPTASRTNITRPACNVPRLTCVSVWSWPPSSSTAHRQILSALGALIKAYDEIADNRNSLKSINNELNCEVAFLKAKLDSEKESRMNDLNDSFKTLDISQAEIEVLQGAVHSLNDKLKLSQLKSKNLEAENLSLSERIDDLDSQVSALKTKTDELTSCRDGLVNSLNNLRSKSNDWDKRRWLDDGNLKYFIDACDKSLVNRDDILIIDPSVTHLLKLSCMEDTESILAQLSVNARTYIFACISDSTKGLTDDSASHWSLLLVDNVNKLSFHFDSSKCLNQVHAKTLSVKLGVCESKFVEMPCAQQRNDFECGINLIVNLKFILNFYVIPKVAMRFYEWYCQCFVSKPIIVTSSSKPSTDIETTTASSPEHTQTPFPSL